MANLKFAVLFRASLQEAHLQETVFLNQEQINLANGDYTTELPPNLTYPKHWPKVPNKQVSSTEN